MGFSVSASTAIIFAGLFLATGILYPAMDNGMERINDAQVDRDQAQLDLRNTAIEIEGTDVDANDGDGEIIVKNTGTTSLDVTEVDLIIDGDYQRVGEGGTSVDGDDSTDLWLPGEQLTLEFEGSPGRIKVVTEHGISVSTEV